MFTYQKLLYFKIGSASGAVCKHVAKWVRGFTAEELEFFSIHFPKDPWQKLADICHLNPEKVINYHFTYLIISMMTLNCCRIIHIFIQYVIAMLLVSSSNSNSHSCKDNS